MGLFSGLVMTTWGVSLAISFTVLDAVCGVEGGADHRHSFLKFLYGSVKVLFHES